MPHNDKADQDLILSELYLIQTVYHNIKCVLISWDNTVKQHSCVYYLLKCCHLVYKLTL